LGRGQRHATWSWDATVLTKRRRLEYREEEEALDQLCHQVRALAESIGHECEPQGDEGCLACLFKSFQRLCAAAFHQNELRITDVADVVALLGVLAPFKATERMKSVFQEKTLVDLRRSDEEWHDVGLDESLATSAVRHCMHGQKGRVGQFLRPLVYCLIDFLVWNIYPWKKSKTFRKCASMSSTSVQSWRPLSIPSVSLTDQHKMNNNPAMAIQELGIMNLPRKEMETQSEETLVVNSIAPILKTFVNHPNTESTTQKNQGLKAN
ncbi:hypothetical protein BGZ58_003283, partial [Dissophora ornata]